MIMKYSDFLLDEQFNINNVIYRFKNKINGKVYIGQTAVPLKNYGKIKLFMKNTYTEYKKL